MNMGEYAMDCYHPLEFKTQEGASVFPSYISIPMKLYMT